MPKEQVTHRAKLFTRAEFSERVFQAIKADIESRGFALWVENFDPNYPVSLRTIHNIRKGMFKFEQLKKLPGIEVEEWFCLSEK